MSRANTKALIRMLVQGINEEARLHFRSIGEGRRNYTRHQKDYALSQVEIYGVRATSRILQIPRRTIQRWCRQYGKLVKRCPLWVYKWAQRGRKSCFLLYSYLFLSYLFLSYLFLSQISLTLFAHFPYFLLTTERVSLTFVTT